ncbi:uncharacterized protein LY89DRAFT_784171 [Mollisia scopiformis]|uniref:Asteroid domain-containing protein n=1 Tax=Mollisia scopiformis TaxID=149040 RepID=A0A194X2E1_MOLSC|nr:uncharacterized protein LY89DRAFT_784171 [Mollisia scopiformis]KUJ14179.1 hypothetical protein LY89DRAFT_784171 [Mollisia scopiformis]
MGVRHLIAYLQPYATVVSLAGASIVVDGPAFAHHVYYLCLRATPHARNGFEAAPSYPVLVKTALSWLDRLRNVAVINKIYFDGFLPARKFNTRLQRLIDQTRRLTQFHYNTPAPCRAAYPQVENELYNLFDSSSPGLHITSLPPIPFLVPAILEVIQKSAEYGPITTVVPGEADLWCAEYVKQHGGLVLTGDSDLLVHDLGPDGSVSFLTDIRPLPESPNAGLCSPVYRLASIRDRLVLPKPNGIQSLAFEMVMDPDISFPNLLKQAQASDAISNYPKRFAEFIEEYSQSIPTLSQNIGDSTTQAVLQKLDPRISEGALQFPWIAKRHGDKPLSPIHTFLPFLLDCPIRTSAWECSTPVRQLAYGILNLIACKDEKIPSIFEHRKQMDKSGGRELELPDFSSISEACDSTLSLLSELRSSLPRLGARQIWIAFAIHLHTQWSIANDKSSLTTLFMQQFVQLKDHETWESFSWEAIQFFSELQASLYSCRILKQILGLVIAHGGTEALPKSLSSLYAKLQSLPDLTEFPTLGDASSALRKKGGQEIMVTIQCVVDALLPLPVVAAQTTPKAKKKRKRGLHLSEPSNDKKRPNNPFELLETE